jgi:uncharacterized protein YciI
MKDVVFLQSADDVSTNTQRYFAAHEARLDEFHGCGTLLTVGTFGNSAGGRAPAIFIARWCVRGVERDLCRP